MTTRDKALRKICPLEAALGVLTIRIPRSRIRISNNKINYETGFISVESDRLRENLILRIKPTLFKAEEELAYKFLDVVKTEFDEFKNQLTEQGVATKNFTAILKNNELSIHILNPKYYGAFIKHLESKNLLPIPNPEREVNLDTVLRSL